MCSMYAERDKPLLDPAGICWRNFIETWDQMSHPFSSATFQDQVVLA